MTKEHLDLALFIQAGYISGAHGIRGEFVLIPQINDLDLVEDLVADGILLNKGDIYQKLEVEALRPHKNGFLILSPQVCDRTQAENLRGWTWLLAKEKMISQPLQNIFLHEIEEFLVIDKKQGTIGTICGFSSNGPQDLIEVKTQSGMILIPLVKSFIEKIDFSKKIIFMDLPDGLTSLETK